MKELELFFIQQPGQIIGGMTIENAKNHFNDYGNCIIRLWLDNWEYRNNRALYVAINGANVYCDGNY